VNATQHWANTRQRQLVAEARSYCQLLADEATADVPAFMLRVMERKRDLAIEEANCWRHLIGLPPIVL